MKLSAMLLWLIPLVMVAAISQEASSSAARKLLRIQEGNLESGESVILLQDEMNSYLRLDGKVLLPQGVFDPEIEIKPGTAVVRSRINLEKAGSSMDGIPFLMRALLTGERKFEFVVGYGAQQGYATTRVITAKIEELEISGELLTYFLLTFVPEELRPYVSGEKFKLQGNVREIRLETGRVVITAE